MENIHINKILKREKKEMTIKTILQNFEENKNNPLFKKGIYVYGDPGTGKTTFVTNILTELGYDIIKYDAGDVRNTTIIEDITKHNMSDKNIMSLFNKKCKKIAIIMDEIDGMNNGDKGGINTLIKLIRPKKTKKQKLEEITMNPIICISNYKVDKKIKELMKVCNTVELTNPNDAQIYDIINILFSTVNEENKQKILVYVKSDLRKLNSVYNLYKNTPNLFSTEIINNILQVNSYSNDTKKITTNLLHNYYTIQDHNTVMNETDRTSVGLLWHENVIDIINKIDDKKTSMSLYLNQLENICLADYIDRITFQKQIWQFNEMSSLMKTFKNNKLLHDGLNNQKIKSANVKIKTKVKTKLETK